MMSISQMYEILVTQFLQVGNDILHPCSLTPDIFVAHLQVHYNPEALPTTAFMLCRS